MQTHHLFIHTGNRSERLLEGMINLLEAAPPLPFERIPFLIQGRGMERWLQQRLSEHFGVWASGDFLFPQHFFDQLAQQLGLTLSTEALARESVRWRIEKLLREPRFAEQPQLKALLQGDGHARRRFQLAEQLANLYDQYQISRMDWLADWANDQQPQELIDNPHAVWQKDLWRALDLHPHRGQLWQQLIDRLEQMDTPDTLPTQVFVFGVSFMPPLMLQVLKALSRHCAVHLFTLSPSEVFWSDLPSHAQRLALLAQPDSLPDLDHHPLLLALGRQGAHFQHLLLEEESAMHQDTPYFAAAPEQTLLGHIQNDLRHNAITPLPEGSQTNIHFHRCHTPQREVEVLRDRILALLDEHPDLTTNDIVVMSPQLERYRPFIETLFAELPHTIADRTLANDAPALQLLADWFALAQSRLEWDAVFAFLQQEWVSQALRLSPAQLDALYEALVEQGQVRWGLNGDQHRNHWRDGFERILLGGLMHAPDALWQDTAPITALEGQSLQQLSPLLALFEQLEHWHALARQREGLPMARWLEEINTLADFFFADNPERLPLDDALAELQQQSAPLGDTPITLETLAAWAQTLGEERRASSGFLSNGITFCDLLPMRAIPVRVAFLLGMDDRTYPRPRPTPTFDLLRQHFRPGDRDLRAEDRYTFLELLLGVRERLEILWQGLSADKNQPQPPAQVVLELMDTLENAYDIDLKTLTHDHPALPFSPRAFSADTPPHQRGRMPADFTVCKALQTRTERPAPLWQPMVWPDDMLPLDTLAEALSQPVHWALQQAGVRLDTLEAPPLPREKLSVNGLDSWQLREALKTEPADRLLPRWQAEGRWPASSAGQMAAQEQLKAMDDLQAKLRDTVLPEAGELLDEPTQITHALDDWTLTHTGHSLHEKGVVHFHPHTLKGRQRLRYWLEHLLINAALGEQPSWITYREGRHDRQRERYPAVLRFAPLTRAAAEAQLKNWLALFEQTLHTPLVYQADWLTPLLREEPNEAHNTWWRTAELACGLRTPKQYEPGTDPVLTHALRHLDDAGIRAQLQAALDRLQPLIDRWRTAEEMMT